MKGSFAFTKPKAAIFRPVVEMEKMIPIFICGHYRSGTSLLHHLLDGHSTIISAGIETNFFTSYLPARIRGKETQESALKNSLLRVLNGGDEKQIERNYPGISSTDFLSTFYDVLGKHDSPKAVMEAYIQTQAIMTGQQNSDEKRYWIEKTPLNELFVKDIISIWPEAKFIHMIRDLRDVHVSVRSRSEFPLKERTTYHNWIRSLNSVSGNETMVGKDCYLVLQYEELVGQSRSVMEKVCNFLSIPFEDVLLNPSLLGGTSEWQGNAISENHQGVSSVALNRWRTYEHQKELRLIEAMAYSSLKRLNYVVESEPVLGMRVQASVQKMILKLKELRQLFRGNPNGAY